MPQRTPKRPKRTRYTPLETLLQTADTSSEILRVIEHMTLDERVVYEFLADREVCTFF
jgi:hypothetical protein